MTEIEELPSLPTVMEAISRLHAGDANADRWLNALQRSLFAWKVADELLQIDGSADTETVQRKYFAAQTMRTKILYAFSELPPDSYHSLRESLLRHVESLSDQDSPVIGTQLLLAVADLVVQLAAWDGLTEVMNRLQTRKFLLLEFLTVLAEELRNRKLKVGHNRREEMLARCRSVAPQLLQMVFQMSVDPSESIRLETSCLRFLATWIEMPAFTERQLVESEQLLTRVFQVLSQRTVDEATVPFQLHESAANCIVGLAFCCSNNVREFRQLSEVLLNLTIQLKEPYLVAVGAQDLGRCLNLVRVFTEVALMVVSDMIDHSDELRAASLANLNGTPVPSENSSAVWSRKLALLLEMVLEATGSNFHEVSQVTYDFWFAFASEAYQCQAAERTIELKPYTDRMLVAVCRHCQLENDHQGILKSTDDAYEFRERVLDLLREIIFLSGPASIFEQFMQLMAAEDISRRWQLAEACFALLAEVAKSLQAEDSIVGQLVDALSQLESSHIMLRHSSIQLVNGLARWLNHNHDYISRCMKLILNGLGEPLLIPASAAALQELCSVCGQALLSIWGQKVVDVGLTAHQLREADSESALKLISSAASILNHISDANELTLCLERLCSVQIEQLNAILNRPDDGSGAGAGRPAAIKPELVVDRITVIFRQLRLRHRVEEELRANTGAMDSSMVQRVRPLVFRLLDVLRAVCEHYISSISVIEHASRTLRFLLRAFGRGSAFMVERIASLLTDIYTRNQQHSCMLYIGSIVVDEFGADLSCQQFCKQLLERMSESAFQMLMAYPDALAHNPDTVDDLFRFFNRFLQRNLPVFLESTILEMAINCGMAAIRLDHKEANESVLRFFADILQVYHDDKLMSDRNPQGVDNHALRAAILQLYGKFGAELIQALTARILTFADNNQIYDVGEIYFEVTRINQEFFAAEFEKALSQLPTRTPSGVVRATEEQLRDVHERVTKASDWKASVRALQDFYKLFL